jgi:DNA-binding YbaB/EbfC family protein
MKKGKRPEKVGGDILAQMKDLERKLMEAKTELAEQTVEASAGGGAVRVVASGTQEIMQVEIAPSLMESGDRDMLQDLVMLAVNQAIRDSQTMAARKLGPLAGGVGPGGSGT